MSFISSNIFIELSILKTPIKLHWSCCFKSSDSIQNEIGILCVFPNEKQNGSKKTTILKSNHNAKPFWMEKLFFSSIIEVEKTVSPLMFTATLEWGNCLVGHLLKIRSYLSTKKAHFCDEFFFPTQKYHVNWTNYGNGNVSMIFNENWAVDYDLRVYVNQRRIKNRESCIKWWWSTSLENA